MYVFRRTFGVAGLGLAPDKGVVAAAAKLAVAARPTARKNESIINVEAKRARGREVGSDGGEMPFNFDYVNRTIHIQFNPAFITTLTKMRK
jgi:hypothetical protein